jgi:hypothetical protein
MTLFWFLGCLQIGIFVLAFLSDLIWQKRKHSAKHLGAFCQGCLSGHSRVEVSGLWFHQYQDCWISCNVKNEQKAIYVESQGDDAPLVEAGVASSRLA